MCYVRKSAGEVEQAGGLMPLDFWLDVARQACEAGTLSPLLTGGEPFTYPHIRELYLTMRKMGMEVSINSNASCITEEVVSWLC
ncbi:MAG: radical SAM protein, partial [Lachnospiraceae bacterium]|nr:radical SAM protein [Lachnospiraceae bacterium]